MNKRIRITTASQRDKWRINRRKVMEKWSPEEIETRRLKRNARRKELMTDERKQLRRDYMRDAYKKDKKPEYHAIRTKRYRLKLKLDAIAAYGGKCTCCGITDHEFLTIDHILDNGKLHRAEVGGTNAIIRSIRDAGYPDMYTVLCFNCNIARSLFGICPHKRHMKG